MTDLTDRARALSRHEHDDASIGDECADEIERLTAERDALREDAERYRLLRRGQQWSVVDGIGDTLRAEQLDAAIDAARPTASNSAKAKSAEPPAPRAPSDLCR